MGWALHWEQVASRCKMFNNWLSKQRLKCGVCQVPGSKCLQFQGSMAMPLSRVGKRRKAAQVPWSFWPPESTEAHNLKGTGNRTIQSHNKDTIVDLSFCLMFVFDTTYLTVN